MTDMDSTGASSPHQGRKSLWYAGVTLLLAAVLLVLAVREVDWEHMVQTLARAQPALLVVAFLVVTGSYFVRGLRWRVLLSAEQTISPITTFFATLVGYLSNSFLPARAGEVIRSVMIGRNSAISNTFALATTLTERILDAVVLVLISLFALMTLDNLPDWLRVAVQVMAVLGLGGVGGLLVAPRLEPLFNRLLALLPLSPRLHELAGSLLTQLLAGMRAFQHPARAAQFAALTVVVWLADALFAIVAAQALHLSLSLPHALLLLAALGLSSALPSTPGYIGIYQFVAVSMLPPFGFSTGQALAYILVFQGVVYVVDIVWGLMGLWRLGVVRQLRGAKADVGAGVGEEQG